MDDMSDSVLFGSSNFDADVLAAKLFISARISSVRSRFSLDSLAGWLDVCLAGLMQEVSFIAGRSCCGFMAIRSSRVMLFGELDLPTKLMISFINSGAIDSFRLRLILAI